MRQATIVGLVLLASCAMAADGPFRQFIEAEDCELTNLRTGRNPLSSYIGDRFAYNIIEGPWQGTLAAPLADEIPPGRMQVFVRVYAGDGERESRTMTVRLGGTQASLSYPTDRLDDKMNWLPFELQTAEPADRVEVAIACASGRVILDSILVSTDPEDGTCFERNRTRLIPRFQPPPEQTARPAVEGNMLVNSGFEVAPTSGWRAGYQSQWALTDEMLSDEAPFEGERCLRVPMLRDRRAYLDERWATYDGIYGCPVQTEPGASYTASVWVRADGPMRCGLGLKGAPQWFDVEGSPDWQRVSVTSVAPGETDEFYVSFVADGPRQVFIDAAQLERGDPTEYTPRDGVAVGLSSGGQAGRIWREGEDVPLAFELAGGGAETSVTVRYLIHDALGRVVRRDSFEATASADGIATFPLHEGPHATGACRVAYSVEAEGMQPFSGQLCYSIIPRAPGRGEGPVGLYASHSRQCFAAMANAGIRWTNTLSSAGHFAEWSYVEPEDDVFVFHDSDIELAREFGIRILANINTNRSNMPKWLLQDEPGAEGEWIRHPMGWFALREWEEMVFALVEHYRDYVKHWLIIDEPDVGTNRYSAEDYFKLHEAAYGAAHRADPDCTVFVHTATSSGWREKLIPMLSHDIYDGQYTYIGRFGRETGEIRGQEARAGKPLWTVDFAPVRKLSTHFPAIDPAEVPPWDETAANTRKYDAWAIESLSWGRSERWFRYDARYPGPPPGTSYMSIWEHDGSLTPHGVSIAVMNALIADAEPRGQIDVAEGVEAHLFAAEERRLLIAWTTDGTLRRVPVEGARAWDAYGGVLDEPLVSSLPTFVELPGDIPGETPVVERVESELLPPEGEGLPFRARFVAHLDGPATGEWLVEGPYFLQREVAQRFRCEAGANGTAELVVPLNVWTNLPVSEREATVSLYLPGRMLQGTLLIATGEEAR